MSQPNQIETALASIQQTLEGFRQSLSTNDRNQKFIEDLQKKLDLLETEVKLKDQAHEAQIDAVDIALRTEIKNSKETIKGAQARIDDLLQMMQGVAAVHRRMDDLENQIKSANGRVEGNQSRILSLEQKLRSQEISHLLSPLLNKFLGLPTWLVILFSLFLGIVIIVVALR